jgi:hypothetical protein
MHDHAAGFQMMVHPASAANMIKNETIKSFLIFLGYELCVLRFELKK